MLNSHCRGPDLSSILPCRNASHHLSTSPWTANHFIKSANKIPLCSEKKNKGMRRVLHGPVPEGQRPAGSRGRPPRLSTPFPRFPCHCRRLHESHTGFLFSSQAPTLCLKDKSPLPTTQHFCESTADQLYSLGLKLRKYGHDIKS